MEAEVGAFITSVERDTIEDKLKTIQDKLKATQIKLKNLESEYDTARSFVREVESRQVILAKEVDHKEGRTRTTTIFGLSSTVLRQEVVRPTSYKRLTG